MKDILSDVMISWYDRRRWADTCAGVDTLGLSLAEIPEETARRLPGGELRIEVVLPCGKILAEMDIPADRWGWLNQ